LKKLIKLALVLISASAGIALLLVSWKIFHGFNFVAIDALNDSREMMGDGSQPNWWWDFFHGGYWMASIPSLILAALGIWLLTLATSIIRSVFGTP